LDEEEEKDGGEQVDLKALIGVDIHNLPKDEAKIKKR